MGYNDIPKDRNEQKKLLTEGFITILKTDIGNNAPKENVTKVAKAGSTVSNILANRFIEICEEKGLIKHDEETVPEDVHDVLMELLTGFVQIVYDHVFEEFKNDEEEPADDRVHAVVGEGIDKAFKHVENQFDEFAKSKNSETKD